jgi:hypothetical protein
MKYWLIASFLICLSHTSYAQKLIASDSSGWNQLREGDYLSFKMESNDPIKPKFTLEGNSGYAIQFDTLGNFYWQPSYGLVDRLEKQKEVSVIVQAEWKDGRRVRRPLNFIVLHQNRPPVVEDLPIFYVKQAAANSYQIPNEYVNDPDGDPLVFKSIQSQLPEGVTLSSSMDCSPGHPPEINSIQLKNNPLQVEFIVQDQPEN